MIVFYVAIFMGFLCCFDRLPLLWGLIHLERGGMPLHDGVGINCKKGARTEVKAQEPSIWAKVCMVGDCACIIGIDITTPH